MKFHLAIEGEYALPTDWEEDFRRILEVFSSREQMPETAVVDLTFTGDASIQVLNNDYRGIDRITDVLSFPLYEADEAIEPFGDMPLLLGDVVISVPQAERQAYELNHSLRRELAFLFVHGLLHLVGYDHLEEGDREKMRHQEECILAEVGVSRND